MSNGNDTAAAVATNGKTLVLGVIGADVHLIGAKVLDYALSGAGFRVVNLGVMVTQEEFVHAAIETSADAILISSMYGQGEIDCRGLRAKCDEAGLSGIPLIVGGNLVIGKKPWAEVEQTFLGMGYTKVYPPGTRPHRPIADLKELLGVHDQA